MAVSGYEEAVDPRPPPSQDTVEAGADGLRPRVAARAASGSGRLIVGGAVLLGLVAFLWLSSTRSHRTRDLQNAVVPSGASSAEISAPLTPPEIGAMEAAGRGGGYVAPPSPVVVSTAPAAPSPPPPVVITQTVPPKTDGQGAQLVLQRRKAPALVVDLAEGAGATAAPGPGAVAAVGSSGPPAATGASGSGSGPSGSAAAINGARPPPGAAVGPNTLNSDEQFAARVEAAEPERVRATMLRNQPFTVPQGAMIPGVLETALNSDLPGYARAVVSRDVRSFDGANVLIPRGSRVIGQYRSAVALGQSRAFVIWTRVIRPDGGSIQIGSSGADQLGRVGMEGKVDRHFFQRFGGAILLSVVNGGTSILANRAANQVGIGSPQQATGLASAIGPTEISPTIKVSQGAPIRIFVARDLDFSSVQAATR